MTKEEIGRVLKKLRIASGKTQKEVAELIGRKQQVIGHWETGYSQPDADTLFVLCDLYNANINEAFGFVPKKNIGLSKREQKIIEDYRSLNEKGQEKIADYIDDLVNSSKYSTSIYKSEENKTVPSKPIEQKDDEVRPEMVRVFRAARSDNNKPPERIDISAERLKNLEEASEADEI